MKKTISCLRILGLCSLAVISSMCSQDELLVQRDVPYMSGGEEDTPIVIGASIDEQGGDADTRATGGLNVGTFSSSSLTAGIAVQQNQTGSYSSGKEYTVSGSALSVKSGVEPHYFSPGIAKVNVVGWYPYNVGSTFTVEPDQSTADNFNKSDLMFAAPAVCQRTYNNTTHVYTVSKASLTFKHQMAKIILNVTAEGVTVNTVTLKNVKRQVSVSGLNSASPSLGSATAVSGATDVNVYKSSVSGSSLTGASAVIPGQSITGDFIEIGATVNSTSGTIKFSLGSTGHTFEGGKSYTINLTAKAAMVDQTYNISDWNADSGTATITVNASIDNQITLSSNNIQTLDELKSSGNYESADITVSNVRGTLEWASDSEAVTGITRTISDNNTVKFTIAPTVAPGTYTFTLRDNASTTSYTSSTAVITVTVQASTSVDFVYLNQVTSNHKGWILTSDRLVFKNLSEALLFHQVPIAVIATTSSPRYAISLVNAASGQSWNTINGWTSSSDGDKIVPSDAYGSVPSPPSGYNWCVLTKAHYSSVFQSLGSTMTSNNGIIYTSGVNSKITVAGGSGLSGAYWSCSEADSTNGALVSSEFWGLSKKENTYYSIRPCLAF